MKLHISPEVKHVQTTYTGTVDYDGLIEPVEIIKKEVIGLCEDVMGHQVNYNIKFNNNVPSTWKRGASKEITKQFKKEEDEKRKKDLEEALQLRAEKLNR